jgi:hypothetical protein
VEVGVENVCTVFSHSKFLYHATAQKAMPNTIDAQRTISICSRMDMGLRMLSPGQRGGHLFTHFSLTRTLEWYNRMPTQQRTSLHFRFRHLMACPWDNVIHGN